MASFCPCCGSPVESRFKFCTECGAPLPSADAAHAAEAPLQGEILGSADEGYIPPAGFTIRFNWSSSANYDFAVRSARKSPEYREWGEGKSLTHQATFTDDHVEELAELLEGLKGLRNRKVWVNGESMLWDEAFAWCWCHNRRKAAYVPEAYCFGDKQFNFNLWGCINSGMRFGQHERWLTYGRFDRDGTFHLDKDRIRHELRTTLHRYRLCPAFDGALVNEITEALPDKVNPKFDRDWEYQQSYGALEAGASVLKVTINEGGFFIHEATVVGVQPANLSPAHEIFKKIGRRLPAPK